MIKNTHGRESVREGGFSITYNKIERKPRIIIVDIKIVKAIQVWECL